jgi:hypothetical protein
MHRRLFAAASLLAVILVACQQTPPVVITETPTAPAATATQAIAPTATIPAATPTSSSAESPIGEIAPLAGAIPASFTGSSQPVFASFRQPAVQVEGRIEAPPIAPDLSNVAVTVLLTQEQRERIAANGFVVSPSETREFYELYEQARYDYVPAFVTSDSLLHVYHLLFDKTLRRAEMDFFIPMLGRLDWELLQTSAAQYESLQGTPWAEAARRNAAYFAVAVRTLYPDWPIPEGLRDLAEPDLAGIAAHNGFGPSAIFPAYPLGEDWSQYVPRGHYTRTEDLKRYFVAMMWHGRMTFRVDDPIETQQAALLTQALRDTTVDGTPAQALWSGIYDPTVFFVGRSDDLTPQEYGAALDDAYGQIADVKDLVDESKFARFREEAGKLRAPEILGMVIWDDQPVEQTTRGLRFMGQRFVPDAFVFRQLIHRNVPGRMLPKALDFFAALGSERALDHLDATGDTALPRYSENMAKLRASIDGYDESVWTQNLYWTWIHSLRPLLEPVPDGYPEFMRSDAWLDKQLTTALGSWTELKRDTILYAKQVYAEMGAGELPPPEPVPPKGYVEPVPLVYARIRALTEMTISGLSERGLLRDEDRPALEAMARTAERLQTIAEKELRGESLTDDEYAFIRFYGAEIEGLTFAADDEGFFGGRGGTPAGGDPLQAAVVADVATSVDPPEVLEQGVGRVFEIYVAVPVEGRLVIAKGGVFSHYELVQPLSDRLTDESWRAMLDAGDAPPLAGWTGSFMVTQTVDGTLAERITRFNDALVRAVWRRNADGLEEFLIDPELGSTRAYIDQLASQNQFVGMQRQSLEFLSFDVQDATHATVATRERWQETLYRGSVGWDRTSDPETIGAREYEVVVTYTMLRPEDRWRIAQIVTRPDLPAWTQP